MKIQEIDINLISTPSFYFMQEDAMNLKKLENSIRQFGILRPIVVKEGKGTYECLEGRQILQIAKSMQQTSIMCVILDIGVDRENTNLLLNILHPQESLAKIAHHIKKMTELTGEANVSSFFPYSIDEIKRFVEICTFDWAQFEKKQNKEQVSLFDMQDIEEKPAEM